MADDFWSQPASLFISQDLKGGPPRTRAVQKGPLNWLIEMAINNNPLPLKQIFLETEKGDHFAPDEILELSRRTDRPDHRP